MPTYYSHRWHSKNVKIQFPARGKEAGGNQEKKTAVRPDKVAYELLCMYRMEPKYRNVSSIKSDGCHEAGPYNVKGASE